VTAPGREPALPLSGRTVVVTRAREQASRLVALLRAAGAHVIEVPVIAIAPASDGGSGLRAAVADAAAYEWIVVTSPNGAAALVGATGGRIERLRAARLAVVGPATEGALRAHGLDVALVPSRFVAEGLLEVFPSPHGRGRVLVAQADAARPVLVEGLRSIGWEVDAVEAYRTVPAEIDVAQRDEVARADAVTFASASTVEHFVAALGVGAVPSIVVSIGPVTTAAATSLGVPVSVEADPHTIDGVVAAVISCCGARQ
jgi:uroporphyrinogen III methyltransferase/synthase